jgi:hypothetical protein
LCVFFLKKNQNGSHLRSQRVVNGRFCGHSFQCETSSPPPTDTVPGYNHFFFLVYGFVFTHVNNHQKKNSCYLNRLPNIFDIVFLQQEENSLLNMYDLSEMEREKRACVLRKSTTIIVDTHTTWQIELIRRQLYRCRIVFVARFRRTPTK